MDYYIFPVVYLLLVSFALFEFFSESLYVYACLHTKATKEEEAEEDDEIDGYPSYREDEDGDGSDKEMGNGWLLDLYCQYTFHLIMKGFFFKKNKGSLKSVEKS